MSKRKKDNGLQQRALTPGTFEVRQAGDDGPSQIVGYAAVFNQVFHNEKIEPGAFKKTLQQSNDVKSYWSHNSALPLGRTENDTLALREDDHGLWAEITPNPDTTWGADALASVERGDVTGMSFGFRIVNMTSDIVDGESVDTLKEIDLREVSPVANPWYESTTAAARDDNEDNGEPSVETVAPSEPEANHSGDVPEPEANHSDGDARADTRKFKQRYETKRRLLERIK